MAETTTPQIRSEEEIAALSDDHIRKVLGSLRADGVIGAAGKGRRARYRRLRADFSVYRIATPVSGSK